MSSLRARLVVLFAGLAAVLGAGAAIGVGAFDSLLDRRAQLVDRVDPATQASDRLLTAIIDQETGVRGYALTGRDPFLDPYRRGLTTQRREARRLDRLTADVPEVAGVVDAAIAAAEAWRRDTAVPAISAVRAGDKAAATDGLAAGKVRFDAFRAANARVSRRLGELRADARDDLDHATNRLEAVILVGLGVVLVAGFGVWFALRRWVVAPVDRLGRAADRVSGGEIERPITPAGPAEIAKLGVQMEDMRARIVDQLAEAERARERLDEQARDLKRSNTELEQFAYVASHDLQEPLRKVAGFCELLQRRYGGELDERADQYIQFAVDGATRMQRLINDLLAFSRVGRTTEKFEPVDLDDALRAALTNLEARIAEAGGAVTSDPLPSVSGDPSLLTALLQNLVGNAIKFRAEEPPRVVVTAATGADGTVTIDVSDNGIGIEPEYAERVFIIFQRLHTKDAYEGTGIGLAMCKKIVEFHGGTIAVTPNPGAGTTVRFTLPIAHDTETHG